VGRIHNITLEQSDFLAKGWRTGIGAVAEMVVSDPKGRDWHGASVREKLTGITNTCGNNMPNCTNVAGKATGDLAVFSEGGGSIFRVGDGLADSVLGINLPARRNTFFDSHIFATRTSELHRTGAVSCAQSCQQTFECVGGGPIGNTTFQIDRRFTADQIRGMNDTRVDVNKT
jgi:hypothetical protein